MKIMNMEAKGLNTFRGLGFIEVDGILVPVCGQELVDFGHGMQVRYVDTQIKMLPKPAPTVRGVFRGVLSDYGGGADGYYFGPYIANPGAVDVSPATLSTGPCLFNGALEGVPLGLESRALTTDGVAGMTCSPWIVPPFKWRMLTRVNKADPAPGLGAPYEWGSLQEYASGYGGLWGNNNDFTPGNTPVCVYMSA